jgi:hypothetical protein
MGDERVRRGTGPARVWTGPVGSDSTISRFQRKGTVLEPLVVEVLRGGTTLFIPINDCNWGVKAGAVGKGAVTLLFVQVTGLVVGRKPHVSKARHGEPGS